MRAAWCCMMAGYTSMTNHDADIIPPVLPPRAPGLPLPRFDTPLVPRNSISGRALVAVVAIMTFLASLTTGAVILVSGAASEWRSGRLARNHRSGHSGAGPQRR